MRLPSFFDFWTVILFVKTTIAYPPSCSDIFGQPTALHCATVLGLALGNGGQEEGSGFYGIAGLDRPAGVSVSQYWNRVHIPMFWFSS